ncbi:MAG: succinylglutamate desuccinylase/aspartoacylase family protein [Burkholderiales bacterium]|nr:succinylglutamate desuccinylase/aspartoacylase family protein [Burkholderiales bacterium]
MEGPITVDKVVLKPGEKIRTWLDIAEDFSGPIRIPFLGASGTKPGKCFYVVSGLNGDNYAGMDAILRVFRALDPGTMRGQVLAIPMLNTPAFDRISKAGADGLMLNRTSGGRRSGYLTERIAHFVLEKIVSHADYALEIITGAAHAMTAFVSLVGEGGAPEHTEGYLDYARAFGCDLLWTGSASPTVLRNAVAKMGVPVIMTELASEGYRDETSVEYEVRGIRNLLGFLGIIEHEPADLPSRYRFFDGFFLHADNGGIFRSEVRLRQKVAKGEPLARISDLLDNEVEVVRAPHDGIVIGYRSIPRIYPGDWSVWVGNLRDRGEP